MVIVIIRGCRAGRGRGGAQGDAEVCATILQGPGVVIASLSVCPSP